jgi:gluconolactonase
MVQTGLDHPECINFGPDGRLYAGGFDGQVYVMTSPKFELRQLANAQGFLGGVAIDHDRSVYVCNASRHRVNRVTQEGEVSAYCDNAPDGPLVNRITVYSMRKAITRSLIRATTGNQAVG